MYALHRESTTLSVQRKVLSVTNASGVAQTGANFIGNINPIRYRGYYYDTDLGLYYLQSRYYDPETGRFVNADAYAQTGTGLLDKNMFAYCLDDPVNLVDEAGDCSCAYDGSAGDFRRLERGLPPARCPHQTDVTEKLNTEMAQNAATLKKYRKNHNYISTSLYFASQVKPGGEWDFKAQDDWALDPEYTYIYCGQGLRYDDIGNIHYGYVGSVVYTEATLLRMGGIVQIATRTSKWEYRNSNFDDPRDQEMVKYGCILWDQQEGE